MSQCNDEKDIMSKLIGCFLARAISSHFLTVIIDHPVVHILPIFHQIKDKITLTLLYVDLMELIHLNGLLHDKPCLPLANQRLGNRWHTDTHTHFEILGKGFFRERRTKIWYNNCIGSKCIGTNNFGSKRFGVNNFCSKKMLGKKKMGKIHLVQKMFGQKENWVKKWTQKKFWSKKM